MEILNKLFNEMITYYSGDPKRIQHFTKVHSYAKLMGEVENLNSNTLLILETAAIVHDIGIKEAERKFGRCDGKLQEQEGPALAEEMLHKLNFSDDIISRVSYLVGHHHTYDHVNGDDYQILLEADFLVNLYEDDASKAAALSAFNHIFKTHAGRSICKTMFAL